MDKEQYTSRKMSIWTQFGRLERINRKGFKNQYSPERKTRLFKRSSGMNEIKKYIEDRIRFWREQEKKSLHIVTYDDLYAELNLVREMIGGKK